MQNDEAVPPAPAAKPKRRYHLSPAGLAALQAAAERRKPWLSSTGPRTGAGLARSSMNALLHGDRSVEVIERRRSIRVLLRHVRATNGAGRRGGDDAAMELAAAPSRHRRQAAPHPTSVDAADGNGDGGNAVDPAVARAPGGVANPSSFVDSRSQAIPPIPAERSRPTPSAANPSSFVAIAITSAPSTSPPPARAARPTKQKAPRVAGLPAVMGAVGFEPTKA